MTTHPVDVVDRADVRNGTGLVVFAALAFGLSWSSWAIAAVAGGAVGQVAQVAGSFGPSLAALVLVRHAEGWTGARRELGRLVRLRGAGVALAVALALPVGLAAGAVAVDRALGGATSIEWPPWWALPIVVGYVLVLGGPLGEELGWRGYLLPRLERRLGPLRATLLLGVVWTAWHLPLFAIDGTVQTLLPFWVFAVQIIATSVVYTWLVHLAPHSLVPSLALHTSFNVTVGLVLLQPADAPAARPLVVALLGATVLAVALARTTTFRRAGPTGVVTRGTVDTRDR